MLAAAFPDEGLAEITLATHFGETRSLREVLERWQLDWRVQELLQVVGLPRALASTLPPRAASASTLYRELQGSAGGFLAQFSALCAWRDVWGRQVLLQYPRSVHGLWAALVWAGTGRRPAAASAMVERVAVR